MEAASNIVEAAPGPGLFQFPLEVWFVPGNSVVVIKFPVIPNYDSAEFRTSKAAHPKNCLMSLCHFRKFGIVFMVQVGSKTSI